MINFDNIAGKNHSLFMMQLLKWNHIGRRCTQYWNITWIYIYEYFRWIGCTWIHQIVCQWELELQACYFYSHPLTNDVQQHVNCSLQVKWKMLFPFGVARSPGKHYSNSVWTLCVLAVTRYITVIVCGHCVYWLLRDTLQ